MQRGPEQTQNASLVPGSTGHHGKAPPAPLSLQLALAHGRLEALLSDGRWLRVAARAPFPSERGSALPADIGNALARSDVQVVNLQLCEALDAWPWEEELALAAGRTLIAPRFLLDLEAGPDSSGSPPPLVMPWSTDGTHRRALQQARGLGRPLILTDPDLGESMRQALERRLGRLWRGPVLMSEALAQALGHLGLGPAGWRLYGDGTMPAEVADQGYRPATVLSIDVVKSTQMMRAAGAAAYAQILRAYHARCAEVIHRLGGSMDQPQGDDGLMAYFGFPLAVEDAASRALMAAWRLKPGLEEHGLQVRIGVASARVAVSGGQPFDERLHLAARLQQAARPGEVLVAGATCEKAGAGFVLEPCDAGMPTLKDFPDPKGVHTLRGLQAGSDREAGGPFVGRHQELESLHAAWVQACRGQAQWCTVVGEPGIGKSRLLQQFSRLLQAEGHTCIRLTGYLHSAHSPLAAVVDGLRQHWQLGPAQDIPALQHRLATLQPPPCSAPEELAQLAHLLGGATPPAPPTGDDAMRRSTGLLQGALESLLNAAPTCLIVDDAHWLDPSSRDLLKRLQKILTKNPVLFIVGERPEGGAAADAPARSILELKGLSPTESEALAMQLGSDLAPAIQRRIVDCSGGVPLYLHESSRMFRSRHSGAESDVPSTLEDLMMVWLDELGPDKLLAQVLSILGTQASARHVDALLASRDPLIDSAVRNGSLQSLLNNGLLQKVDGPTPGYRFKHALIREQAYDSIWLTDRQRLHGLCADLLARSSPEVWQQRPEWMAHHLQEAGHMEAARRAWVAAARLAKARHAHPETLESARRALSIPARQAPDAAWDEETMHLHLWVASALVALEGYGSARAEQAYLAAEQAVCHAPDPGPALRVKLGLEACCVMRGDLPRARQLAQDCVDATRWQHAPLRALQARWALANVLFHQGETHASLRGFDDCLAHYREEWHVPGTVQDPGVMCYGYSSWIHFELGDADEALRRVNKALALATLLKHPFSMGVAHGFAASLKRLCGDWQGALGHAKEAVRICEQGGFQVWLAHAWMVHGQLLCDQGQVDEGLREIDRGYALWEGGGARISCATYQVTLAELLLRAERTAAAQLACDKADSLSLAIGESHYRSEILRVQGLCEWQAGRAAAAGKLLEQALAQAAHQGKPGLSLRCAVSLAAWRTAHAPAEDTEGLLGQCLQRAPGHATTRDAAWARTLLQARASGQPINSRAHTPWEPL